MCFNIYWSAGWAALGLAASIWVKSTTSNTTLAIGVCFFFLMEFLQVIQHLFLATGLTDPICDTTANQILTLLGFIHICLQPYFLHSMNWALLPAKTMSKDRFASLTAQYAFVKKLCLIGGFLLFLRYPLSYVDGWDTLAGQSTEWLRGNNLCTYKTGVMHHLGWSVPMADPTYNIMGTGIHSFLMFAPFLAMSDWSTITILYKSLAFQGAICYATGPFFASLITDNLQEQASVWCLFSIAQVSLMLFRMYGTVKKNYPLKEKK